MGVSETGNGRKCKRNVWLSESWGKNPKSVWWNNEINAAVRRKEVDWKEVFAASDEEAKERCMEAYREKRETLKGLCIRAK